MWAMADLRWTILKKKVSFLLLDRLKHTSKPIAAPFFLPTFSTKVFLVIAVQNFKITNCDPWKEGILGAIYKALR